MATAGDAGSAAEIAHIYNQSIEDRIATFEAESRTTGDIERLLAERDGRYPTMVVERGGGVAAWVSAGTYRSRPCYDPIAEPSVYVDRKQGCRRRPACPRGLVAEAERLGLLNWLIVFSRRM
jgi:L-amino acid N-acyltransferase YncA